MVTWLASLRRNKILAICLAMLIVVAAIYLVLDNFRVIPNGKYDKSIVRNTDNIQEEYALAAAENANYSGIFETERFDGSSDPEAYLHPGTYLEYTYANFIDAQVTKYYDSRFESLKGKPRTMEYSYEATVYKWDQIRFLNGPRTDNQTGSNDSIIIMSPNGTTLFENPQFTGPNWGMRFAYNNGSEFELVGCRQD